jgi:hypothetical protein
MMDRRTFLRRAGSASAAAGATALAASLGACTTGRHGDGTGTSTTVNPTSTTGTQRFPTTTTASGSPPWAVLAGSLQGRLVRPGDASYAVSAELYNELLTSDPAAIAYCASAADVQRCVGFAQAHGVPLAARSGGHSYAGYSSSSGVIIDVSSLNTVAPGNGRSATVGAGAQLIDVYSQLAGAGVLIPGGSCPTVGIAGMALGGGIGVFGRAYGMTCDNVAGVQIVTADGVLHQASPSSDSDLYWACRGGGGGNFGVVTSFTFTVHPIPSVTLFTLEWPWSLAGVVLASWLPFITEAPDELWSNCQLYAGGAAAKVTGVYAGSTAACASALNPLLTAIGAAPSFRFVGPEDYLRAVMIEAGCENLSVTACHLPGRNPGGTLSRSSFVAKSSYINAPLPSSGVQSVIDAVHSLGDEIPGVGGGVVFDGYGGAINRVAAGDTAFVHRDAVACAQYSVNLGGSSPPASELSTARGWLTTMEGVFAPYAKGSYQNYIDPTLPDWADAYYGSNLPRLRQVKQRYDPGDVFHFAQSIPLPAAVS